MRIPNAFKRAQRTIFQDKTIDHYKAVKQMGKLGSVTVEPADITAGSYTVNFRLVTDAMKAQEWGLQCNKDATFSTSSALPIENGDFIKCDGVLYRITTIQPHDSHEVYLCKAVS